MGKLLEFLVIVSLCVLYTSCEEKVDDYDYMEVDMADIESIRQDVADLEKKMTENDDTIRQEIGVFEENISNVQRSCETKIIDSKRRVEKILKIRMKRVQRTIREKVDHLVSESLQEILKSNTFTDMLNNEHLARAQRLQQQLMQIKGQVTELKKEASESREGRQLLEMALKKNTEYTRRLEERLGELEEGLGDRSQNCCQRVMELSSNCCKSEVSGSSASCKPVDVPNHSFEDEVDQSWDQYNGGYTFTSDHHDGNRAIKVINGGASLTTIFSTPVHKFIMTAYSRRQGSSRAVADDYSVYCDLLQTDGQNDWGHYKAFNQFSPSWQRAEVQVYNAKGIVRALCYLLYRNFSDGWAVFDDVTFTVVGNSTDFSAC